MSEEDNVEPQDVTGDDEEENALGKVISLRSNSTVQLLPEDERQLPGESVEDWEQRKNAVRKAKVHQQVFSKRSSKRPTFNVKELTFEERTAKLLDVLVRENASAPAAHRIYSHNGRMIRTVERGPKHRRHLVISELKLNSLKSLVAQLVDFFKEDKKTGEPVWVDPPGTLLSVLLAREKYPFPELSGIIEVPVIRPDGSILSQSGYDDDSGLFLYLDPAFKMMNVPDKPNKKQAQAALKFLLDAVIDFPFEDEASRAHVVALWLTPIVRELIDGPTPLCLVDATSPGSGKSSLLSATSIIMTGKPAKFSSLPKNEDEMRKQLFADLRQSAQYIFFDNVPAGEPIKSDTLCMLLVSSSMNARILGQSTNVDVDVRSVWGVTGNNVKVGKEIPRRCYYIKLDPKVEKPWERPIEAFKHGDFLMYVKTHRAEFLQALLTLARYWVVKGSPAPQSSMVSKIAGNFSEWGRVVGGILEAVDVKDFMANHDRLFDRMDVDRADWAAFFSWWYEKFGDRSIPASTLAKELGKVENADARANVPDEIDVALSGGGSTTRRLGKALGAADGKVVIGVRLMKGDRGRGGTIHWRLVLVDAPSYEQGRVVLQ